MKNHLHLRRMRVWAIMFAHSAVHWQIPKAKHKERDNCLPMGSKGLLESWLEVGNSKKIYLLLWHKYFNLVKWLKE